MLLYIPGAGLMQIRIGPPFSAGSVPASTHARVLTSHRGDSFFSSHVSHPSATRPQSRFATAHRRYHRRGQRGIAQLSSPLSPSLSLFPACCDAAHIRTRGPRPDHVPISFPHSLCTHDPAYPHPAPQFPRTRSILHPSPIVPSSLFSFSPSSHRIERPVPPTRVVGRLRWGGVRAADGDPTLSLARPPRVLQRQFRSSSTQSTCQFRHSPWRGARTGTAVAPPAKLGARI